MPFIDILKALGSCEERSTMNNLALRDAENGVTCPRRLALSKVAGT